MILCDFERGLLKGTILTKFGKKKMVLELTSQACLACEIF